MNTLPSENNKQSGLYVYIVIYDLDCDPILIDQVLGIKADSIQRMDDLNSRGQPFPNPTNAWEFGSELYGEKEMDNHINHLFNKLGDLSNLSKVTKAWKVQVKSVVDFRCGDNDVILGMSEESIAIMAKWKASLDVSYYLWDQIEGTNYAPAKFKGTQFK